MPQRTGIEWLCLGDWGVLVGAKIKRSVAVGKWGLGGVKFCKSELVVIV